MIGKTEIEMAVHVIPLYYLKYLNKLFIERTKENEQSILIQFNNELGEDYGNRMNNLIFLSKEHVKQKKITFN